MPASLPSPARTARYVRLGAFAGACLVLTACVTKQLVPDFATYSEAYAHDLNWQMLLNLARLDQGHPAYFMAIGEIRLSRTQAASLQGSGSSSHTAAQTVTSSLSRTVTNVLSGTLTPNVSNNAVPTYSIIPLNSEDTAQQLLEPISIEVFNTLYQQGWPVDQLLRVLVERIEVDRADGEHLVLQNSPTRADTPASFTRFLRACEVVRELQKRGGLQLVVDSSPGATGAPARAETRAAGPGAGSGDDASGNGNGRGGGRVGGGPSGGGTASRSASGSSGSSAARDPADPAHTVYRFRANPAILDAVLAGFARDTRYAGGETLENFREVFHSSLTVGSGATVDSAGAADPVRRGPHSVLVLRSFRNVLDAVAQEQRAFDELAREDPSFLPQIPERQQRPILRTDWTKQKGDLLKPVAQLSYFGTTYQVTDAAGAASSLDSRWNRDVFRLLIDLSSQVTVDITKFQRQVLELSQ